MVNEKSEQEAFYELCYYTTAHLDPNFIHQYVVDAFAAQTADKKTKPITLTFALIGLYLHLEKNFTGKQVQQAHMQLARHKKSWPHFKLPEKRGDITVYEVIDTDDSVIRDKLIIKWCESVWAAYEDYHTGVINLVKRELWSRKD
jgi:Family of unknown function (DUF5946)